MSDRETTESVDFKPSNVLLHAIPLVGTLRKAEHEAAAALVIRTLQANGDTWRAVSVDEVARVVRADVAAERQPVRSLNANPFFRPDFYGLAPAGWATVTGTTIELTPACLEAVRRYVRRPQPLVPVEKDGAS